jgi:hypothetical protein
MGLALDHKDPELVYAASLVRMRWSEVSLWYLPLTLEVLKQGTMPTFLESCFFEKKIFQSIGKFDVSYELRSDFDFFCRFILKGALKNASTARVVIDYEEKGRHKWEIWQQFTETWSIIYSHFGFKNGLLWLWQQKDLKHFFQLMMHDVKKAVVGN